MSTLARLVEDENVGRQDVIQISEATRNLKDGSFVVDDYRDGSVAIAWLPRNDFVWGMSLVGTGS